MCAVRVARGVVARVAVVKAVAEVAAKAVVDVVVAREVAEAAPKAAADRAVIAARAAVLRAKMRPRAWPSHRRTASRCIPPVWVPMACS